MQKHCTKYNDNYSIVYWYDNSGNVVGFFYTDKTAAAPVTKAYIYTKNTLGDVTGIVDSTGNIVAKYVYDPWGMVIAVTDGNGNNVSATANHIANINPIRYRGYYLDSETGFYYLQSRYYFPLWKRFINADDSQFIGTTGTAIGVNAFAYCENSPIENIDLYGYIKISASRVRWLVDRILYSICAPKAVKAGFFSYFVNLLKCYWPLISATFNILPGAGQFLCIAGLVLGAVIAVTVITVLLKAYFKNKSIYFGIKFKGWKPKPYFYYK